jgi:hypothetical protein
MSGADGQGIWMALASAGREGRSGWHETRHCRASMFWRGDHNAACLQHLFSPIVNVT